MIPWLFGPESIQDFNANFTIILVVMALLFWLGLLVASLSSYEAYPSESKRDIRRAYYLFALAVSTGVMGVIMFPILFLVAIGIIAKLVWKSFKILRTSDI